MFYVITLSGIAGMCIAVVFSRLIPITYKLPLELLSILLFTFGVYTLGAISTEAAWQLKVSQMEAEIAKNDCFGVGKRVCVVGDRSGDGGGVERLQPDLRFAGSAVWAPEVLQAGHLGAQE